MGRPCRSSAAILQGTPQYVPLLCQSELWSAHSRTFHVNHPNVALYQPSERSLHQPSEHIPVPTIRAYPYTNHPRSPYQPFELTSLRASPTPLLPALGTGPLRSFWSERPCLIWQAARATSPLGRRMAVWLCGTLILATWCSGWADTRTWPTWLFGMRARYSAAVW